MKAQFFLFIIILSSCSNYETKNDFYIYNDSANYHYEILENGLLKQVRFFPGTNDTSGIVFYKNNKIKDSTAYYFDREGNLKYNINYKNNMHVRKCQSFYKNGNIKKEFTLIDSMYQGNIYYYYKSGLIKAIHEIILLNGEEYLNNERVFDKKGRLLTDSTFFFDIYIEKDTIAISDSLLVFIYYEKDKDYQYTAFTGSLDSNYRIIDDDIYQIPRRYFFYKPNKIGKNYIRIVFETNITPDSFPTIRRVFKEKTVYVREYY